MSGQIRRSPADYPIPRLFDFGTDMARHEDLVLAATLLVSVHKLAGPHDGGVMMNLAVRDLIAALEPWRID